MTASKRPARKADAPATLSVPRVRAVITDADSETVTAGTPRKPDVKPRKRRPKFVF